MAHPNKKQKVGNNNETYREEVLFNIDTLSKIISYLPSVDVLNLAITCKRFGISDVDEQSIIKKSAHILVQDIASEEQLTALPHYDGESSLADYHYLQLMREPLTFDQLVGKAEYVNDEDKSCVMKIGSDLATAFSNNIMRAGKHYASFKYTGDSGGAFAGVIIDQDRQIKMQWHLPVARRSLKISLEHMWNVTTLAVSSVVFTIHLLGTVSHLNGKTMIEKMKGLLGGAEVKAALQVMILVCCLI